MRMNIRSRRSFTALAIGASVVLTLAACSSSDNGGSTATDTPTTTQSESVEQTSDTPTESTNPPDQTSDDAETSTTETEEPTETLAPPEKDSIVFSYSAAVPQLEKVPIRMALEKMDAVGITSWKESFHQGGEDAVQAVARGESDFGTANAPTVLAAIGKGVPIKAVMTTYFPAYVMVAAGDVTSPCDLTGKKVGIHAQVSATTLYTNLAFKDCPADTKPDILVVPGSAARVQALLADQLDASVVQFADVLTLEKEAPGKFHVIYDVTKQAPGIVDSLIFVSTDAIAQRPNYIKAALSVIQQTYASVYDDEPGLAAEIQKIVPDTSAEAAQELAKTSVDDKLWPADGAFDDQTLNATIDALRDAQLIDPADIPTVADCCTAQFLTN